MHIPQDVVKIIIDQMVLDITSEFDPNDIVTLDDECLRATSLVASAWVHPSQRHLFSIISFDSQFHVKAWCSRIKPDPCGVSRHVRVLRLWNHTQLCSGTLEMALPHFVLFTNLRELDVGIVKGNFLRSGDITRISLDVLIPIFSSFSRTLRRLRWSGKLTAHDSWEKIRTLVDLLPNLVDINLSSRRDDLAAPLIAPPCIHLPFAYQVPDILAFKRFKFQKLVITDFVITESPPFFEHCQTHLRILDLRRCRADLSCSTVLSKTLQGLFKVCHALEEISFPFRAYVGRILGSIPSCSVALIHIEELALDLTEYQRLGVSIRTIAQRFSERHHGSKTRVKVSYQPPWMEERTLGDGNTPVVMTEFEKEIGACVTLELNLLLFDDF